MKELELNYLNIPEEHPVMVLLRKYGDQISSKTLGFLSYILANSSVSDEINSITFYIYAPVINKEHRLISIDFESVEDAKVILWSIKNDPIHYNLKIVDLEVEIGEILSHNKAKEVFKFLVEQSKIKLNN